MTDVAWDMLEVYTNPHQPLEPAFLLLDSWETTDGFRLVLIRNLGMSGFACPDFDTLLKL